MVKGGEGSGLVSRGRTSIRSFEGEIFDRVVRGLSIVFDKGVIREIRRFGGEIIEDELRFDPRGDARAQVFWVAGVGIGVKRSDL